MNRGNETAVVDYDSAKVKLADLERAATDAGYAVISDKVVLKIGGMTCAMCVKTIEEAGYQYLGVAGEETEDLEEVARERDLREKRSRFNVV